MLMYHSVSASKSRGPVFSVKVPSVYMLLLSSDISVQKTSDMLNKTPWA